MIKLKVPKRILALYDEDLKKHIKDDSFKQYQKKSKPLQVDTVLNLLRKRHTFLLEATGFGKLRIPDIWCVKFVWADG
jgi:hypothetical protein